MAKHFDCEYCHKSFKDTIEKRRKHRASQLHRQFRVQAKVHQLKELFGRLNSGQVVSHFDSNELKTIHELFQKPKACNWHFASALTTGEPNTSQCRYGQVRCKDNHTMNDEQIDQATNEFTERLMNILKQESNKSQQEYTRILQTKQSKRQLKRDIFLNRWLETRFGLNQRNDIVLS